MPSVEIKKLKAEQIGHFKMLMGVFERVFEWQDFAIPQDGHLQALLKRDDFLVFVAVSDGKVVGGLTAYIIQQYYSGKPLAYIYDLAVEDAYQRKGIGTQLMNTVMEFCKKNGMEEVFVQAEAEDTHAVAFYKACGGVYEEVVHFTYPLSIEPDSPTGNSE